MNLSNFRASLALEAPPAELSKALSALWWDAKGDWNKAHECAQADKGTDGAWVHAYLHRREGDLGNAEYWYRRARQQVPADTLAEEWAALASALLVRS